MIKLKSLLEEAKLDVESKPGISPEDKTRAAELLYRFFEERETLPWLFSYSWRLVRVNTDHIYVDGERYSFEYVPKKGREVKRKPYADAEYTRTVKSFRTPKDAIEYAVADDMTKYGDTFVFRGMNMAEWVDARKQGHIKSKAAYNIGGILFTYFGKEWGTAHSYAAGFAPFDKEPTRSLPGVIVAVPKELTQKANDVTGMRSDNEYVADKIPIEQVKGVWYVVPTEIGKGFIEIVLKRETLDRGSASPPGIRYVIVPKAGIALK